MELQSLIPSRRMLSMLCGMAFVAGVSMTPARADLWNKKTVLTVAETVQVADTVLPPGQYVMKLLNSQSDRHIVQIFNRDETHIIDTVLAIPRERLVPVGHTAFTYYETPPGSVRALRTWFYPGDLTGQQFFYPKHPQMVAMAAAPASIATTSEASAATTMPPASEPAAAEQTQSPEPQASERTTSDVAENSAPTPEPDPQAPETPAHSIPDQPAQLPRTGSPYPAIGIAGGLLVGLAGLLRVRRIA
jgi:LPXTG-motif cell wall-anchored protein